MCFFILLFHRTLFELFFMQNIINIQLSSLLKEPLGTSWACDLEFAFASWYAKGVFAFGAFKILVCPSVSYACYYSHYFSPYRPPVSNELIVFIPTAVDIAREHSKKHDPEYDI